MYLENSWYILLLDLKCMLGSETPALQVSKSLTLGMLVLVLMTIGSCNSPSTLVSVYICNK